MQLAEPDRVEPNFVAEVDLGQDVVAALLLRKAGGAGQLVEKSEAHASSRGPILSSSGDSMRSDRPARQADSAHWVLSTSGDVLGLQSQSWLRRLRKFVAGTLIAIQTAGSGCK